MNYKSKLFWIGILQLLLSGVDFLTAHPGASILTIITGVLTLVINWVGKPEPPPLTLPAAARMNWLDRVYSWVWFHFEFWVTNKLLRRPFTYWMRDFWHKYKVWGTLILFIVTGLIVWGCVFSLWFLPLLMFHGMLLAHLVWGSEYIPGQQEDPPVTY